MLTESVNLTALSVAAEPALPLCRSLVALTLEHLRGEQLFQQPDVLHVAGSKTLRYELLLIRLRDPADLCPLVK